MKRSFCICVRPAWDCFRPAFTMSGSSSCLRQAILCCAAQTGLVDMDKLEEKAMEFRPKMIICGECLHAVNV